MLTNSLLTTTIPVADVKRTKDFFVNKLGLSVDNETATGITFKAGGNTKIYAYKRGPSKADHTLASFAVDNIEAAIDELVKNGVVFEQYDFPGLKTNEKGISISEVEGIKGAWFKDPDGNIFAINEPM